MADKETTILTDNAVKTIEEDKFGFAEQAGRLAKLVAGKYSPENIAVGVSGSWGSGKSSMLNLIKCYLTKPKHYLEIFMQDYPGETEEKVFTAYTWEHLEELFTVFITEGIQCVFVEG